MKKGSWIFVLLMLTVSLFAEPHKKDYANYKDWQLNSKKAEVIQHWEETELNYANYSLPEYIEQLHHIKEHIESEAHLQNTFEYADSKSLCIQNLLTQLDSLIEACKNDDGLGIMNARIKTNLAIIEYENLQVNIVENNYSEIFSLFIYLIIILVLFVFATAFFAIRLVKSIKNEQSTSGFNHKILKTQEQERTKISMELHDTIAQDLRAILLLTEEAFSSKNDEEAKKLQSKVLELESKSIMSIRTICYNLTPPDLDRKDLRSALSHYCSTFQRDSNIECSLVITEDCNFDNFTKEDQLNFFRLVQEALNNVAKHSKAEEVTIVIRTKNAGGEQHLLLLITDDGVGFNLESTKFLDSHFGLRGMKERTNLLNGKFKINTAPDEGTEVQIEIPLK